MTTPRFRPDDIIFAVNLDYLVRKAYRDAIEILASGAEDFTLSGLDPLVTGAVGAIAFEPGGYWINYSESLR